MVRVMEKADQRGFILPAVLWLMAAMTIAAAFFGLWTERAVQQAREQQADHRAELEMRGTEATLFYLLATRPYNYGGLMMEVDDSTRKALDDPFVAVDRTPKGTEIRLDDQLYQGFGDALFSVQNLLGLVGMNGRTHRRLENLLGLLGVPNENRSRLVARLNDYTDYDEFHRLNGAEAKQYLDANREPPPNRNLRTPWEARSVLGWDDEESLWVDQRLPRLTSTLGGASVNLNTSPAQVLQTIDGIDADAAQKLIAARPLRGLTDASLAIGRPVALSPEEAATLSGDILRITLRHPESSRQREIAVRMTPTVERDKPWIIEYDLDVNLQNSQGLSPEPAPTALFTPPGATAD